MLPGLWYRVTYRIYPKIIGVWVCCGVMRRNTPTSLEFSDEFLVRQYICVKKNKTDLQRKTTPVRI